MEAKKEERAKHVGPQRDFLPCELDLQSPMVNRQWSRKCDASTEADVVAIRFLHWNMLAQRLADEFDLIRDDSPMLKWDNRMRLYKQHFEQADADVIGVSEIDCFLGKQADCIF